MTRLVLVCMAGHTPLRPSRPVHCPPSIGPCSKIVGSNPCDSSQRAAVSPPGPAPITATLPVIGELSHGSDPTEISLTDLHTGALTQPAELTAEQWRDLVDGQSKLGRLVRSSSTFS